MGIRMRKKQPLRSSNGFDRHQKDQHIQRVERREAQAVLSRIFKLKSGTEFLKAEPNE